jgi:hypothetical protein
VGWGRVTTNDSNPVARQHPQNQAEKRAKARALRDAFSIPLPNAEEADGYEGQTTRYIENGEQVDTPTGGVRASQGQLATIHLLCKGLGIDEEARHNLLQGMFGEGHSNDLTEGEAAAFLEYLGNVEAERLANDPAMIQMRERDQAIYEPGQAASKRFHTAQVELPSRNYDIFGRAEPQAQEELTQSEAPATEQPPISPTKPPAQPPSDVETASAPVTEEEIETLGTAIPKELVASLMKLWNVCAKGQELPWNDDARRRAAPGRACMDRLRAHNYTPGESAALFKALHFAGTGEDAPILEAGTVVSARVLVALQELPSPEIEALLPVARWFLGRESS